MSERTHRNQKKVPVRGMKEKSDELMSQINTYPLKFKRYWSWQSILRKNNAGGITLTGFRLTKLQRLKQGYWHQNRHTDQRNRTELRDTPTHMWAVNL